MPVVNDEHGFALIIALGFLSIVMIMALSLSAAVRADLEQTRRFQDATAAEFLAKGGVEWAIHYLNMVDTQGHLWQAPWQDQPALFRGRVLGPGIIDLSYVDASGETRYGLQDEEARVNVNTAPAALLAGLPGSTPAIADAIVKQRQQRRLVAPEELVARGIVSAETFYGTAGAPGIDPYLTVWGSGKINLNTAPKPVLGALPGMTAVLAEAIVQHRQGVDRQPGTADDRYFRAVSDLLAVKGMTRATLTRVESWLTVAPTAFRVGVTGQVISGQGGMSVHRRLAIIDRTSRPSRIQYWRRVS
jgi:general secretion pathway protein K